jgi:hypothetical protein
VFVADEWLSVVPVRSQGDVALMRFEKYCFGLGVPVVPVAMKVVNPWPLEV